MASSTRGSIGVVDWLSMKMGSLSGIVSLLPRGDQLVYWHYHWHCYRPHGVRGKLGERHGVEQSADAGLDFLNRPPQIAARILRTIVSVGHAAHDLDLALEGPHHLPHDDRVGAARELIATLRAVMGRDEPALGQPLEDLGEELRGNVELFGNALGVHRSLITVGGDVVHGHESIVRSLREPQHSGSVLSVISNVSLYPTKMVSATYSRSLPPGLAPVKP